MPTAPLRRDAGFRTVSLNVKNNPLMPQRAVVHDVRRAAEQGGLIGWNEIGPTRYAEAIRALGPDWGHYMPFDGKLRIPNPISWKKAVWQREDAGFVRTHEGRAKVTPRRYITWARLRHRATGRTVVRVNTHLISGAWSGQRPTTAWRRERWHEHLQQLDALVADFKRQGYVVIVGGDFNRDSFEVLGDRVRYDNRLHVGTHGQRTLDYLMHTPGGGLRRERARVQGGYASDHDAVVVRYRLRAAQPA